MTTGGATGGAAGSATGAGAAIGAAAATGAATGAAVRYEAGDELQRAAHLEFEWLRAPPVSRKTYLAF